MVYDIQDIQWTPASVRALRLHVGMTQAEFGVYLGYSTGANVRVSELERGTRSASGPLARLLSYVANVEGFVE